MLWSPSDQFSPFLGAHEAIAVVVGFQEELSPRDGSGSLSGQFGGILAQKLQTSQAQEEFWNLFWTITWKTVVV